VKNVEPQDLVADLSVSFRRHQNPSCFSRRSPANQCPTAAAMFHATNSKYP
jgi:hypothetical protein